MVTPRILVCDDQQDVLIALQFLLKGAGYQAELTNSPHAALDSLKARTFDLVLTDMNFSRDTTSGREGLDLVERIRRDPAHDGEPPPVVVMTAWGDIDLAVQAMRRGAMDFVQKPWENSKLLATLERCIRESRGARNELDIARSVQHKLLPHAELLTPRVKLTAAFEPAREVGGDYYDFFELPGGRVAFLLADVSGKGVPAAMLMANLQALFRAQPLESFAHPLELALSINKLFHSSTKPEHYATLFYAHFDPSTGLMRYINAGHPAGEVKRRDGGSREEAASTGAPIGLFSTWAGTESWLTMTPGDTFTVVSDGVLEADEVEDDRTVVELLLLEEKAA